jgi:hypothetical protein
MNAEEKVTLRDVAESYRYIADLLEALPEDNPEEYERAVQQFSATITMGREKVDRFAGFLRRLKTEQDHLVKEAHRIRYRIQVLENLERRLREYAVWALQNANLPKISGRDSTLSLRNNQGQIEVFDADLVPAEFKEVITQTIVSKIRVRKAIDEGREVPGVRLVPTVSLKLDSGGER